MGTPINGVWNNTTAVTDKKPWIDEIGVIGRVREIKKVIILDNGAYGIGNGAECDYAAFHAADAAKQIGYTPILINSNLSGHLTGPSAPCRRPAVVHPGPAGRA